jgi:hypothetical protein
VIIPRVRQALRIFLRPRQPHDLHKKEVQAVFRSRTPWSAKRRASSVPFGGRTNRRGRKSNAILQQFRRDHQNARDQPCPPAKNVRLLRPLDRCVLPSGAGLIGGHSARVSLNRRNSCFSLSRLGEHALARITSVIVSWTWVWLLPATRAELMPLWAYSSMLRKGAFPTSPRAFSYRLRPSVRSWNQSWL